MRTPSTPLSLRRIDAMKKARHRLMRPHRARCILGDGVEAELLVRAEPCPINDPALGLPLSTRFGPAIAYDYGALLLAFTGVDMTQSTTPSAHAALARCGFAALEPALQAALGEPTVSDTAAAALEREPTLAVNLLIRLPALRLTMRLVTTPTSLHALLDNDFWQPLATPAAVPAWLGTVDAAVRLIVGESTLPLAACNRLARGDIVRLATCPFDVAGRATVRIASHNLQLRWLDSHRCFEVEDMSQTPNAAFDDRADQADRAPLTTRATSSIDTGVIPVCLSFSLGALRLTVADVAALRPGSLLELTRGLPPAITIEANGQPIGAGELVDLDGRLAVEITQWPPAHAPAPTS